MDDVGVHYNSTEPEGFGAHAFARASDIHLAPGQEGHLAHEAWHIAQQRQGRVKATAVADGSPVNEDRNLENEADRVAATLASSSAEDSAAPVPDLDHFPPSAPDSGDGPGPAAEVSKRDASSPEARPAQLLKITSGIGMAGDLIWDTDWAEDDKRAHLTGESPHDKSTCAKIIQKLNMRAKGLKDEVLAKQIDADVKLIRALRPDLLEANASPSLAVQARSPAQALKPTDTGGAPPHKKTPEGNTRIVHMNYKLALMKPDLKASAKDDDSSAHKVTGSAFKRSSTEYDHFQFFVERATALGLRLEILTNAAGHQDIKGDLDKAVEAGLDLGVTITDSPDPSQWAEDSTEFLQSGVTGVLTKFNDTALQSGMKQGRQKRWAGLVPQQFEKAPFDPATEQEWVHSGILVNANDMAKAREEAASGNGVKVGHLRAYIEGGNMISGESADGQPVILLGKDAIAATAYAYEISDEMARATIAEDFGVKASQILCVEQPGKFHLDMGLLFIGKGVVIVNDSTEEWEAAKRNESTSFTPAAKKITAQLGLRTQLEALAVKDLQEGGMKVVRQKLESGTSYNFFNGEFVTGKDGETYYLTNGGPSDQQEKFRLLMTKEWGVVKDVFFTSRSAAEGSLTDIGGVGCRIKGSPPPLVLPTTLKDLARRTDDVK